MAGRKNRPVLYELVRRTERQKKPPGWTPSTPTPRTPTAPVPATARRESAPEDRPAPPRYEQPRDDDAAPVIRLADGKVHLSIGWIGGAAIGVGLIMLLAVSYQAGARASRQTAPAEAPDRVDRVIDVIDDAATSLASADIESTPMGGWRGDDVRTPGLPTYDDTAPAAAGGAAAVEEDTGVADSLRGGYFVVAKYFKKSQRRDAEIGRDLLAQNGIDAVIEEGSKDIRLWVATRFDSEAAARPTRDKVRQLGWQKLETDSFNFGDALVQKR